jgi:hypothetical protein
MAFDIPQNSNTSLENPEALFHDLRKRDIQGLFSNQADIIRQYSELHNGNSDIALQLPTGSGKTLIGLLIGEWRRRKFRERVIYLCPTNQLVNQVASQANNKYGIEVNAFTGSKINYSNSDKSEYKNSEKIAITTYSSLFNVNPYFSEPNMIILDDAHSSENYIADNWSVLIDKSDEHLTVLYNRLCELFKSSIKATDYRKLKGHVKSSWDKNWVDKIPTPYLKEKIPELVDLIDNFIDESNQKYSWSLIRDNLHACHLYISSGSFLIRPIIPPTNTHQPFAQAKQRVYMSATLGEGGDLERITGRSNITRLNIPSGWDKQGIGRRLFSFPERSLESEDVSSLILNMVEKANRSLMIVPNNQVKNEAQDWIESSLGYRTFSVEEIESSKEPFVNTDNSVAIIANRFDGIDFPDEECRLLFLMGVPRATNLQESFIISRMGGVTLLNDRILTRIVQAFGRCTRSATDYASILVFGEELHNYLLKSERRAFLHPEINAELSFGIEQSKDRNIDDFVENFEIFLDHSKEWEKADDYILSIREQLNKKNLPGTSDLKKSVSHELNYIYFMWDGDFNSAYDAAKEVLETLNHPDLRGYRALWNYLAGSSAWNIYDEYGTDKMKFHANDHFENAFKAAKNLRWLSSLYQTQEENQEDSESQFDSGLLTLVLRLEHKLEELGTINDGKFVQEEKFILQNIAQDNSNQFEKAHKRLGNLLGFEAGNSETSGAPDPWWIINDELGIVFEDHSESNSNTILSVKKARQVASHPNWIKSNLDFSDQMKIVPVLITSSVKADNGALPHLKDVCYWELDDFRKWAEEAVNTVKELRKDFKGVGDLGWRGYATDKYQEKRIAPNSLVGDLLSKNAQKIYNE